MAVLYTTTTAFDFDLYNKQFYLQLTKLLGAIPMLPQDCNYYRNKALLQCLIVGSENAIFFNSDIVAAQNCLDQATKLISQQSKFF